MVMVSLKKAEIILIQECLIPVETGKDKFGSSMATILLDKLSRFTKFARGKTKAPAKKAVRRSKKASK